MTVLLEIRKLPDDEFAVVSGDKIPGILYTGNDVGAVHSILELGYQEGRKFRYQIKNNPLTLGLIKKYSGNRDIQNLNMDLHDEYSATRNYSKHILETENPVIKKQLQEIRGEEEHHIDELKELLKEEV